jgi:purine-binding chemotaxis protein CheW
MIGADRIVVFTVGRLRCGISLAAVERVVRMVEITPLPEAPPFIRGVINVQGEVTPVIDLRRRFGLPERAVELRDQLIITSSAQRNYALMADAVSDVCDCPECDLTGADDIFPDLPFLGVAKLPDGMVLLHDLDKLLSPHDMQALDDTLPRERT